MNRSALRTQRRSESSAPQGGQAAFMARKKEVSTETALIGYSLEFPCLHMVGSVGCLGLTKLDCSHQLRVSYLLQEYIPKLGFQLIYSLN